MGGHHHHALDTLGHGFSFPRLIMRAVAKKSSSLSLLAVLAVFAILVRAARGRGADPARSALAALVVGRRGGAAGRRARGARAGGRAPRARRRMTGAARDSRRLAHPRDLALRRPRSSSRRARARCGPGCFWWRPAVALSLRGAPRILRTSRAGAADPQSPTLFSPWSRSSGRASSWPATWRVRLGGPRWHGIALAASGGLLLTAWRGAGRALPALLVIAVLGLALALDAAGARRGHGTLRGLAGGGHQPVASPFPLGALGVGGPAISRLAQGREAAAFPGGASAHRGGGDVAAAQHARRPADGGARARAGAGPAR